MVGEETLRSEAIRLYRRYAVEIVEGFNLCPWATRSRLDGLTKECVFLQENTEDLAPSLAALATLEAVPDADVVLFIYPFVGADVPTFEGFGRRLGSAYRDRCQPSSPRFVVAVFHPDPPDPPPLSQVEGNPEVFIPYLRQTPDPTLQWVRHDALERVRKGRPGEGTEFVGLEHLDLSLVLGDTSGAEPAPGVSLRRRIAHQNLTTIRSRRAELEASLASVRRDREATYARLRT